MLDKIVTLKRERLGDTIGRIDEGQLLQVNRLLAVFCWQTRRSSKANCQTREGKLSMINTWMEM